jgi:hypothetical protein
MMSWHGLGRVEPAGMVKGAGVRNVTEGSLLSSRRSVEYFAYPAIPQHNKVGQRRAESTRGRRCRVSIKR